MVENTRGYSNSSKTRQIGSLRVTANYYTWCILWLVHLTQHVVTSNSAVFMHTCTHTWKQNSVNNATRNNSKLGQEKYPYCISAPGILRLKPLSLVLLWKHVLISTKPASEELRAFFLGVPQPKKPQELETANFLDFNFFYYILNLHLLSIMKNTMIKPQKLLPGIKFIYTAMALTNTSIINFSSSSSSWTKSL